MKFLLTLLMLLPAQALALAPSLTQIGGPGAEWIQALTVTPAGKIVTAGAFDNSITLGNQTFTANGDYDFFLVQMDDKWNVEWARAFGSAGRDVVNGIDSLPDGSVVIGGHFQQTLVLDGHVLNSRGREDGFVARIAAGGEVQWAFQIGGTGSELLYHVSAANGRVGVGMSFSSPFLSLGGQSFTREGARDGLAFTLTSRDGSPAWSQHYPARQYVAEAPLIALTEAGTLHTAGYFYRQTDLGAEDPVTSDGYAVFLTQYSPGGAYRWHRKFPTSLWAGPTSMAVDSGGDVLLGGTYLEELQIDADTLTARGQANIFLAKLQGDDGSTLWTRNFGGDARDENISLASGPDRTVLLTTTITESMDFGNGTISLPNGNQTAMAMAQLDRDGNFINEWNYRGRSAGSGATNDGGQNFVCVLDDSRVVWNGWFFEAMAVNSRRLRGTSWESVLILQNL